MNYLLIHEDGSLVQMQNQELTEDDIQCIHDGVLAVVRFQRNQFEEANPVMDENNKIAVKWERV